MLINTGGGMAGGDRMTVDVAVGAGAEATLTTQAAEKIYRSDGADTEIAVGLALEAGSRLDWLPQEQILFDGARLRRRLDVGLAGDAPPDSRRERCFRPGRDGRGRWSGSFRDRWRIRRDGRLVFAEDVRLEGPCAERSPARRSAGGARGAGDRSPPRAGRRGAGATTARAALDDASSECGVSAWNGMLVARFLSPRSAGASRRSRPLPRTASAGGRCRAPGRREATP